MDRGGRVAPVHRVNGVTCFSMALFLTMKFLVQYPSTAKAKIKSVAIQRAIGLAVRTVAIRELIEVMRDLQLSRLNEPTPTEERLGGCNKTQLPLQFIA